MTGLDRIDAAADQVERRRGGGIVGRVRAHSKCGARRADRPCWSCGGSDRDDHLERLTLARSILPSDCQRGVGSPVLVSTLRVIVPSSNVCCQTSAAGAQTDTLGFAGESRIDVPGETREIAGGVDDAFVGLECLCRQ